MTAPSRRPRVSHKWGIGVDANEYKVSKRILTSALKQTGVGVYKTVVAGSERPLPRRQGDRTFSLKNGGVGVAMGKGGMSPKVKPAWIEYDEPVQEEDLERHARCSVEVQGEVLR